MRKLGIIGESEHIDIEAQDDYARLFLHDLSRSNVAALAALFGWTVPDDAEVRCVDLCVWVWHADGVCNFVLGVQNGLSNEYI